MARPSKAGDVLSNNAADLITIATRFGGFNKTELMARVLTRSNRKVNTTTVENVLQEMYDESRTPKQQEADRKRQERALIKLRKRVARIKR